MSEARRIPAVVLIVGGDSAAPEIGCAGGDSIVWRGFLRSLVEELAQAAQGEASFEEVEVVVAAYPGDGREVSGAGELTCTRLRLRAGPEGDVAVAGQDVACALYTSLEACLTAVGSWILKRPAGQPPMLVVHITRGKFECSAEVEQKAGMVKAACDLCSAPSVFFNLLVTEGAVAALPCGADVDGDAPRVVKTLFRMSTPVGNRGAELLAGLGSMCHSSARHFEAVRRVEDSVVVRFAGRFLAEGCGKTGAGVGNDCLSVKAFRMAKEGYALEECEDVVSVARDWRRFVISDGATEPSYSGEWARALCRQAIDVGLPVFSGRHEAVEWVPSREDEERLQAWLEGALGYWQPEVPWERLTQLSLCNKAKEGTGASLAGMEILGSGETGGVRFRGWALGDSCVIHFPENQMPTSRPICRADQFNSAPILLMTTPGFTGVYLRHWQCWEGTLAAGEMVVLATDALSKFILQVCEVEGSGGVMSWLRDLQCDGRVDGSRRFEAFVEGRRQDGQMKDDDVALVVIGLKSDGKHP